MVWIAEQTLYCLTTFQMVQILAGGRTVSLKRRLQKESHLLIVVGQRERCSIGLQIAQRYWRWLAVESLHNCHQVCHGKKGNRFHCDIFLGQRIYMVLSPFHNCFDGVRCCYQMDLELVCFH